MMAATLAFDAELAAVYLTHTVNESGRALMRSLNASSSVTVKL